MVTHLAVEKILIKGDIPYVELRVSQVKCHNLQKTRLAGEKEKKKRKTHNQVKDKNQQELKLKIIKIKKSKNESMYLKKIIKESINKKIIEKNIISEEMKYHIDNNLSITDNIFRHGSEKYFEIVNEARQLHGNGYRFNDFDTEILESEVGTFVKLINGDTVALDFPFEYVNLNEAEYKGKKVSLNKPKSGGSKKWYVYVRNPKSGNVKKVSYGSPVMTAKWNDPAARKSFAARHRCEKKKDKTKAGYWACRAHKDFGKNVSGRFW